MNDQIVLIVRLRVEKNARNVIRDSLIELFGRIRDEDNFVSAILHEDLEDAEQLLVYEVWRETRESFVANQLSKAYRAKYEELILERRVQRTPQWLKCVGSWNSKNCAMT